MQIQQGDVLLNKITSIPNGVKKVERKKRGFVLAEGEHTGHAHVIEDEIEMYEKDGVIYISSSKTVSLTHEEHKPVTISPGIYKVGIVQEYDHFAEEARNVAD